MDLILAGCVKVLTRIILYTVSFWLGSVVWNAGVGAYLGSDFYMTFQWAVVGGWFLKFFFA
jgi:hypothetical protein